ncbi:multiple sugar transport system permease protein [Alicyclobacillus sacchari]|uniref:Multiple sugar transport system permease protein n=1 Tax=Alicyclobacillus sacchari TaxID=392010 RepID=A0A4V3HEP5_9BACL|nr:carbohydrate ABC transporter permease [Alicyclobacillus sacchari]TDY49611.1 multiple sugar transport system permease protein [Alicyclobacillus sacchari]GMA58504.1 sugar ABC transporter permease [Alicyclobacillus sacchari]
MLTGRRSTNMIKIFVLIAACVITLFPVAWMISTAFTPNGEAFSSIIPAHATIGNFITLFGLRDQFPIIRWLCNSLLVATCTAVLVTLIDSLAAFALARLRFWGRKVIFNMVIVSLVVPFIALLIPLYVEFAKYNLIDSYWALILPYTSNAFGVFLLYQFFIGIPNELQEAAVMDGANKLIIWKNIFLPLSTPATATLALLTFMNVYNDFFWPLVATTSTPMRTLTVGVQVVSVSQYSTNYPLLMTATLISVIPMVIAFLFTQRQLMQGVVMTGIK